MHTTTIRGATGEVRYGYRRAAALRDVVVSVTAAGTTLAAVLVSKDDYALSQRPLSFALTPKPWRWAVVSLQIEGTTLTASLAPLE